MRFWVVAWLLVAGCAASSSKDEVGEQWVIPADFDRTWGAVVDLFAEAGWPTARIERSNGLVASPWMRVDRMSNASSRVPSNDPQAVDELSFALVAIQRTYAQWLQSHEHEGRITVTVADHGDSSLLTVSPMFREEKNLLGNSWRAALRHAAAELGAGHAQHVAEHPQERHLGIHVDLVVLAVDAQSDHVCLAEQEGGRDAHARSPGPHSSAEALRGSPRRGLRAGVPRPGTLRGRAALTRS